VDWKIIPAVVKKSASIGANATIICGAPIGKKALVANLNYSYRFTRIKSEHRGAPCTCMALSMRR